MIDQSETKNVGDRCS